MTTMNDRPKVSICIPTYNQVDYIREAVESALSQEGVRVEIVISDNHCSDGTSEYLAALKDLRCRVVRPAHHLSTAAENYDFCVSKSRGDYFNILASDNRLLPGHSRTLSALLDEYPDAACAYGPAELVDTEGRVTGDQRRFRRGFVHTRVEELRGWLRSQRWSLDSAMFRRQSYDASGGFQTECGGAPLRYIPEWDFALRLHQHGGAVYTDTLTAQFRFWRPYDGGRESLAFREELGRMYENTAQEVVERYPELRSWLRTCRRRQAMSSAYALAEFAGTPTFELAAQYVLGIYDDCQVRAIVTLHRRGLSTVLHKRLRAGWWIREKAKALLHGIS